MRMTIAAAALALALGASASAQTPPAPSREPGPPTAQATAEAARLIAAAAAEDLFEDVSAGKLAVVRHRSSGATCSFNPDTRGNRLVVFQGALARGDDIGCSQSVAGFTQSIYVTRYPGAPGVDELMGAAIQSLRRHVADAKPYEGPSMTPQFDPKSKFARLPAPRTAQFVGKVEGKPVFTLVSIANVGAWSIKVRMTGPQDKAGAMQLLTIAHMAGTELRVAEGQGIAPP